MTTLDFLIIYLSLGAPFGAYRLVRNGTLSSAVFAFLLWPTYAARSAFTYLFSGSFVFDPDAGPDAKLIDQIEHSSRQFSNSIIDSHRLISKDCERSLDRYVELSLSSLTKPVARNGRYFDLLTISGNPSAQTGTACLERRNKRVVARHLSDARRQLIGSLANLTAGKSEGFEIVGAIADLLGDTELSSAVSSVPMNKAASDKTAHNRNFARQKVSN